MRKTFVCAVVLTAGCLGQIGGDDDAHGPGSSTSIGVPEVGMRRLSAVELDHTLADLLGVVDAHSAAVLPADSYSPFDNDYTSQIPSRALVEAAETLARNVVAEVLADPKRTQDLLGCAPANATDEACFEAFIRRFGRRALRRPLTDAEVLGYLDLAKHFASQENDFLQGVDVVVRAFLEDIEFLYRVEFGTPSIERPGAYRLDGFEVATRMSYLIWGTTPDDALLDAAEAGSLDGRDGVIRTAEEMLASPRARDQIDRFHAMWLGYETLHLAPPLTASMRKETRALIDRVVFDDRSPWTELFLSKETFVDDTLAAHYGLPSPGPGGGAWMDYSAEGRSGILSHGSFLSVGNEVGDTSPVRRGLLVLRRLTCQDVPPPPPNVDTNLKVSASECKLAKLEAHAQGSCASCHSVMDPIGFGLEQYDGSGRFRDHEDNKPQCPIDGEGSLVGVGPFNGPAELGARLVDSGLLDGCAVQHLYRYAMGRGALGDDEVELDRLTRSFVAEDRRFDALVVTLVSNDAFFYRRPEGGS